MTKTSVLRRKVKLISFSTFIGVVLILLATSGYTLANKYKRDIEYGYLRSLNELSDSISTLEVTMNKGIYANTMPQQFGLANKIISQTVAAKMALEQLPVDYLGLDNINKFVSQTGDFANYLTSTISKGQTATDEEMENLKKLGEYAKTVNSDLKEVIAHLDSGKIDKSKISTAFSNLSENESKNNVLATAFKEMNDNFTNYPSLIYDGPFSDHITRMKSKFLENVPEVSKEQAKENIVKFLGGNSVANLEYVSETSGNLPEYKFKTDSAEISVTKQGGYVNYILKNREISDIKLSFNEASHLAKEFMSKSNIGDMKESYYSINNGICTINYAYSKNNVICYPDLIKIGVALDNGEIISYNSTGYLMNHSDRNLPGKIITQDEAKGRLSKYLKPEDSNLAVIPTAGLNEVLCYEFECTGENKDKVLVYINAQTGLEEQIFVVLSSDNGILVM